MLNTFVRCVCLSLLGWTLLFVTTVRADDTAAATKGRGFKNVGVTEFDQLRSASNTVILDVRSPKEFAAGHIPGAINLDVNGPEFDQKAATLSPNKTYLVHCAAGVRSAKACDKLAKLKFPHLINLEPGYRGWEKAGKPTEK